MSDFLYNLIARSLDRLEVAQPRLASLFEPPPSFNGAPRFEQELGVERPDASFASEEADPVDPPTRLSTTTRTRLHLPQSRPAKDDAPEEADAARDHAQLLVAPPEKPFPHRTVASTLPSDQSELTPSAAKSLAPSATRQPDDGSQPPRPKTPEAMREQPVQRPAIETKSQRMRESEPRPALESAITVPEKTARRNEDGARAPTVTLADAQRPGEQAAAPAKVVPQSPGDMRAQSSPRKESLTARPPAIEAPARRIVVERLAASEKEVASAPRAESPPPFKLGLLAPVPQPLIVQPLVKKHEPPSALKPDALSARPEESNTIQVTIGRLEVRAAPRSETRAPTASPAPPLMSLNEYLRQRTKGGAR